MPDTWSGINHGAAVIRVISILSFRRMRAAPIYGADIYGAVPEIACFPMDS